MERGVNGSPQKFECPHHVRHFTARLSGELAVAFWGSPVRSLPFSNENRRLMDFRDPIISKEKVRIDDRLEARMLGHVEWHDVSARHAFLSAANQIWEPLHPMVSGGNVLSNLERENGVRWSHAVIEADNQVRTCKKQQSSQLVGQFSPRVLNSLLR
jgi:hypothetical protein